MKIAIVKLSDITGHPTSRMDAEYWVGKANGKKAFKKVEGGKLVEDDNGKVMATDETAAEFNKLKDVQNELEDKQREIKNKLMTGYDFK